MSKKDLYNIDSYTDQELYNILDLNSPSDRELEAKIISFIKKYNDMNTEDGDELSAFFHKVYKHFFDTENDDKSINGENTHIEREGFTQQTSSSSSKETDEITNPVNNNEYKNKLKKDDNSKVDDNKTKGENISYSNILDYTSDNLNPLLKQTIKRIINVDSQYRDNKDTLSTDFTFFLNEPLKDVVSLSLYSIQLPYAWYTVNNNYGSNLFYLKGNSPGINIGNYDFIIDISSGNYTNDTLISTINTSLTNLQNKYTDVSFINMDICYNSITNKSRLNFDFNIQFNETDYDIVMDASIATYLGYKSNRYSLNSIVSNPFKNDSQTYIINYYLTTNNNYFTVNVHKTIDYTKIDLSFNINLGLTTPNSYNINTIMNNINSSISQCQYLDSTHSKIILGSTKINGIDSSASILSIKLNRYNNNTFYDLPNIKTTVVFPDDSIIWIGNTSAFKFNNTIHSLGTLKTNNESVSNNYIFNVESNPYILLSCNKTYFNTTNNNYTIPITNNNYSINDFSSSITNSINEQNEIGLSGNAYFDSDSYFNLNININRQIITTSYTFSTNTIYAISDYTFSNSQTFYNGQKLMNIIPKSPQITDDCSYTIIYRNLVNDTFTNVLESIQNTTGYYNDLPFKYSAISPLINNASYTLNIYFSSLITQNDYSIQFMESKTVTQNDYFLYGSTSNIINTYNDISYALPKNTNYSNINLDTQQTTSEYQMNYLATVFQLPSNYYFSVSSSYHLRDINVETLLNIDASFLLCIKYNNINYSSLNSDINNIYLIESPVVDYSLDKYHTSSYTSNIKEITHTAYCIVPEISVTTSTSTYYWTSTNYTITSNSTYYWTSPNYITTSTYYWSSTNYTITSTPTYYWTSTNYTTTSTSTYYWTSPNYTTTSTSTYYWRSENYIVSSSQTSYSQYSYPDSYNATYYWVSSYDNSKTTSTDTSYDSSTPRTTDSSYNYYITDYKIFTYNDKYVERNITVSYEIFYFNVSNSGNDNLPNYNVTISDISNLIQLQEFIRTSYAFTTNYITYYNTSKYSFIIDISQGITKTVRNDISQVYIKSFIVDISQGTTKTVINDISKVTIQSFTNYSNISSLQTVTNYSYINSLSSITNYANMNSLSSITNYSYMNNLKSVTNYAYINSLSSTTNYSYINSLSSITNYAYNNNLNSVTNYINKYNQYITTTYITKYYYNQSSYYIDSKYFSLYNFLTSDIAIIFNNSTTNYYSMTTNYHTTNYFSMTTNYHTTNYFSMTTNYHTTNYFSMTTNYHTTNYFSMATNYHNTNYFSMATNYHTTNYFSMTTDYHNTNYFSMTTNYHTTNYFSMTTDYHTTGYSSMTTNYYTTTYSYQITEYYIKTNYSLQTDYYIVSRYSQITNYYTTTSYSLVSNYYTTNYYSMTTNYYEENPKVFQSTNTTTNYLITTSLINSFLYSDTNYNASKNFSSTDYAFYSNYIYNLTTNIRYNSKNVTSYNTTSYYEEMIHQYNIITKSDSKTSELIRLTSYSKVISTPYSTSYSTSYSIFYKVSSYNLSVVLNSPFSTSYSTHYSTNYNFFTAYNLSTSYYSIPKTISSDIKKIGDPVTTPISTDIISRSDNPVTTPISSDTVHMPSNYVTTPIQSDLKNISNTLNYYYSSTTYNSIITCSNEYINTDYFTYFDSSNYSAFNYVRYVEKDMQIAILQSKLNEQLKTVGINVKFGSVSKSGSNYFLDGSFTAYFNNNNTIYDVSSSFWYTKLRISPKMISSSYKLNLITSNNASYNGSASVLIKGASYINSNTNYFSLKNSKITFIPMVNGLITDSNQNNIIINIPENGYTQDTLIRQINQEFTNYSVLSNTTIDAVDSNNTKFNIIIDKHFTANDYKLVFYDNLKFINSNCNNKIQNTLWDTTLGWILGFRKYTTYDLSIQNNTTNTYNESNSSLTNVTIAADTILTVNIYNYFMLSLDDYTMNHLNDGLISITGTDSLVTLPSYATLQRKVCNPTTNTVVYSTDDQIDYNKLTQKQLYSLTSILNNKQSLNVDSNLTNNVESNLYSSFPFTKDLFAMIPVKTSSLKSGQTYVEFGGSLQNQERKYFGPVNIKKMSVKLITDHGDTLDLNGCDWSFSLLCEQMYKQKPSAQNNKK